MNNNLISVIADHLNIKIGEEFKLIWEEGKTVNSRYKFDESVGLLSAENSKEVWTRPFSYVLQDIILGKCKIEKIPFEPKDGEKYWTFIGDWYIHQEHWDNDAYDNIHKEAGCIFRTKEEALNALPLKYKEITGKTYVTSN